MTVDKVGVALPFVERGELDQGQHDGLRDVFAVPGAFTLVRASAFAEIGGFDEAICFLGDDLSLCWRIRWRGPGCWYLGGPGPARRGLRRPARGRAALAWPAGTGSGCCSPGTGLCS